MRSYFKNKRILVTGGMGFLGTNVVNKLLQKGVNRDNIIIPRSSDYDLRNATNVKKVVKNIDVIIHLAAKVGGIGFNKEHPAEMFYDNLIMGIELMHQAYLAHVQKFVAVGTICCYPKYTKVPFKEENLWDGYPEETNAPYGLAKKMLLVQSQAYRQQYGFNAIFLLPVNLYGCGDNFNPDSSHVIPALVKKFFDAKTKGLAKVDVWGTGRATREFLYVEDAAKAIIMATEKYNKPAPINIGAGFEISIKELAYTIAKIIGYKGKIVWDTTKPDGQPRRMLDTAKAQKEFGFKATTSFAEGLRKTITYYEKEFIS